MKNLSLALIIAGLIALVLGAALKIMGGAPLLGILPVAYLKFAVACAVLSIAINLNK
jgi:hypothetical protein